jgi:hypothetical protein
MRLLRLSIALLLAASLGGSPMIVGQNAGRTELISLSMAEPKHLIEQSIEGFEYIDYQFTLAKDQTLKLSLVTDNPSNTFDVYAPAAEKPLFQGEHSGNELVLKATESGVYTVRVYLLRLAARDYQFASYSLALNLVP